MENKIQYIRSMKGSVQKARGYGDNGYELSVTVSFDAKQFNKIKKTSDPLAAGMAQIKNVVFDATGVRGYPGYQRASYSQQFPRASKGLVTLTVTFDISTYQAKELGVDLSDWNPYLKVDLQSHLEKTREDGHLFAKTALAAVMGH